VSEAILGLAGKDGVDVRKLQFTGRSHIFDKQESVISAALTDSRRNYLGVKNWAMTAKKSTNFSHRKDSNSVWKQSTLIA
jgi:hypothetical protein